MGNVKFKVTMNNLAKSGDQALNEIMSTLGADNPQAADIVRDAEGKIVRVEVNIPETAAARATAAIDGNSGVAVVTPPITGPRLMQNLTGISVSKDFAAVADTRLMRIVATSRTLSGAGLQKILGSLTDIQKVAPVYTDGSFNAEGLPVFNFHWGQPTGGGQVNAGLQLLAGDTITFQSDDVAGNLVVTATRTYPDPELYNYSYRVVVDELGQGWLAGAQDSSNTGLYPILEDLSAYDDVIARGIRF